MIRGGGYLKFVSSGGGASLSTAKLMKTGQTTSYRTGDDGDTQRGRNTDFFTLDQANPFGHFQRFTGMTGGYYDQGLAGYYDVNGNATTSALAFPNHIVCDWSTQDLNGDFNMWYRGVDLIGGSGTLADYDAAFTYCAGISAGGFTDWTVPNANEMWSLIYGESTLWWVFLLNNGFIQFWTCTNLALATSNALYVLPVIQRIDYGAKTANNKHVVPFRIGNISEL